MVRVLTRLALAATGAIGLFLGGQASAAFGDLDTTLSGGGGKDSCAGKDSEKSC